MEFLSFSSDMKRFNTKITKYSRLALPNEVKEKRAQSSRRILSDLCDALVSFVFKKSSALDHKIFFSTITFFLLLILLSTTHSQVERETRAVWLTTNHRLDWPPPTYNAERQKQTLTEIFDEIKEKNLNTVYFQVRSNGTVMFNSSFESFSEYITGKVNGIPSFDPLKLAIEEAHKRGLEIHAWLNMMKVFEGKDSSTIKNPDHICKRKPEWIIEDMRDGQKSYWLDPGLPEVKNYLADMITELVENYDVDGIHLDYIRYPGKNFDDDFSYRLYGKGQNKDDWRRQNITSIVEEVYKNVKAVNSYIKIGAAPIGIYKNIQGARGWESYFELYQDSYNWLKKGIVDYLTPQTYWGMDENPRFDLLANDWMKNSNGRNVVFGIAAYKENIRVEVDELINYSRSVSAAGVSFFRYEQIKNLSMNSFAHKTFPAAMPWMDGVFPAAPVNLSFHFDNENRSIFTLNWENRKTLDEDSVSYFALYNLPGVNGNFSAEHLFEIIPGSKTRIKLAIDEPRKINYYFALKSVNKVWNESKSGSNTVTVQMQSMKKLLEAIETPIKPLLIKDGNQAVILLMGKSKDIIEIYAVQNKSSKLLASRDIKVGQNIFLLEDISSFKKLRILWIKSQKEAELSL